MRLKFTLYIVLLLSLFCAMPFAIACGDEVVEVTEANKKLVLDFFRIVFQAENADAAKDYLSENYIQHNPKVPGGKDGFINFFKAKWKEPKPVMAELKEQPESVIAEGDLVMVMRKLKKEDPSDSSKTYDSFWFDVFRVKNGKLVEHWDNATK